ncbi:hypothetical protein V8G56_13850 [Gaetbulibacter aquiaggeris]|uniref:Uncharacterized protein n=1 Tax=Gaetbulibacter aquiaggeris TaxID=1735373 RepID=A0ABW7MSM2_9FLAO
MNKTFRSFSFSVVLFKKTVKHMTTFINIFIRKILSYSFAMLFTFTSCRKEEVEFVQAPSNEVLVANSSIAGLIKNTTINDGSNDNIIDKANCFNITFPFNVTVNGISVTIASETDYLIVEYILDESDDDVDNISISYPVTITLDDYKRIIVNNSSELSNYSNNCNGENQPDDDVECLDFQYPITASVFNKDNEILETVSFNSDNDLIDFFNYLNTNYIVTINFPINVLLLDGSLIVINNLNELETTINTHKNDCDEDDDYDYNDDDCNDCNPEQLESLLTSCSDWTIDKLERYNRDYDNYYDGYTFNFSTDGIITVYYGTNTDYGTWTASGSGNNLVVVINVPDLPYCNNNWILHEISQYSESKIDLRVGDNDRMRYKNSCN